MTTAFTICANNYLAHAKTLALSFKEFHPDIDFVIALVDKKSDKVDYENLGADRVLFVDEIVADLSELATLYGIAELSTVVKPNLITFLHGEGYDKILYIDPDIKVYSRFEEVLKGLENQDVVLTPHICSPTEDNHEMNDKNIMRTGVYNLGFVGLNMSEEVLRMVDWWNERVRKYGFHDIEKGNFYDQIWMQYAPAFLDKVLILRHRGYNMANWNLHERSILKNQNAYFVNHESHPLRFFHFSHFKLEKMPVIASYNEKFTLDNREDLRDLFNEYCQNLISNDYNSLKVIPFQYGKKHERMANEPFAKRMRRSMSYFKQGLKILMHRA